MTAIPTGSPSEAQFQRAVTDLATLRQWRWVHSLTGVMQSGKWATPLEGSKGFPDLLLVRERRLVIAELKVGKNRPSEDQQIWLSELAKVPNCEVYLWRPEDWSTEIVKVLN